MKKISIYVVTHKSGIKLLVKDFIPIAVGNAAKDTNNNFVHDNTKINISNKNSNYCELTAQYWIWKNDNSDVKGLCHYRRYFSKSKYKNDESCFLNIDDIDNIISKGYSIVSKKLYSKKGNIYGYDLNGFTNDLVYTRDVIKKLYPDYLKDFDKMLFGCCYYPSNMFIAKREFYDAYSHWLFSILDELEKVVDITDYSIQEKRIFGYISERLLIVWLNHNKIKVKQVFTLNTEQDSKTQNFISKSKVSNLFKYIIYILVYKKKVIKRYKQLEHEIHSGMAKRKVKII